MPCSESSPELGLLRRADHPVQQVPSGKQAEAVGISCCCCPQLKVTSRTASQKGRMQVWFSLGGSHNLPGSQSVAHNHIVMAPAPRGHCCPLLPLPWHTFPCLILPPGASLRWFLSFPYPEMEIALQFNPVQFHFLQLCSTCKSGRLHCSILGHKLGKAKHSLHHCCA